VEQLMKLDERKRPYNSMFDVKEPTEEEKEAFMIKRPREDDPMMQFLSKK
jgi:pre-mRNA-processing factor SLU7